MKNPSAATVIATLALFVALGGTGYAAVALAPNSVGSAQIKDGAVQSSDIKDGAVSSDDIANGAIGSDDIKSGSIQVSDLSKGAMNGLDGKDGAQGPAGPAGPKGATGAQGPAGPAGSSSGGGGGVTIRDADGNVVDHVIPQSADLDPATGVVHGFWQLIDGVARQIQDDGFITVPFIQNHEIVFLSDNCSGPAYIVNSVPVGSEVRLDAHDFQRYTVSNTTVPYNKPADKLSGYSTDPFYWHPGVDPDEYNADVPCTSWGNVASQNLRLLTPLVIDGIAAPMTYDRG